MVMDVREDQNIGNYMPIFNFFPLLVTRVCGNAAQITKGNELNKVVEPFDDGSGVVHRSSEFGLPQVF